jgi:hypothetical protein
MNQAQAISLANDAEHRLPVAQWRRHGVQIWPIIRSRLIWAAFNQAQGNMPLRSEMRDRAGRRVQDVLRSARVDVGGFASRATLRSRADAVIVTDGIATMNIGKVKYDVLADPLREFIAETGAVAHTWYTTYACLEPRHTPGALLQWRLDLAQAASLGLTRRDDGGPSWQRYDEFLAAVRVAGLQDASLAADRMSQLAARIAIMAGRFERWLRATSPRVVFVNCYYSLEGAALMLACRRSGIVSIDVQHGVQGLLHVAYGSWCNVPPDGYDLLPDRFWCWSEREVDAIRAWAAQTTRHFGFVGGNLWLEKWSDEAAPFVRSAHETVRTMLRPDTHVVLVTLQWGIADRTFLLPLLRLIRDAGGRFSWWLRLHPVMRGRRDEVRALLDEHGLEHVLLDQPTELPLPALLQQADIHLTHSSSAVLEAASLGVGSIITGGSGAVTSADLVASGMVTLMDTFDARVAAPLLETVAQRRSPCGAVRNTVPGREDVQCLLAPTTDPAKQGVPA